MSGCIATRDFVRESLGQQKAESDQRFTQVETRRAEDAQWIGRVEEKVAVETQRVEGMGFRVGKLETTVDDVGKRADGAFTRAESAHVKATEVDERLTRLWNKRHARNTVDSLDVKFGFNRADLDDGAQTVLLNVIRELQANPQLTVDLTGYTDPNGPREYNVALAHRRVEAVRRFMVQQGVEIPRISSIGLGPLDERGVANDKKRRVTVKLMMAAE
jgi:outer membrane protein OmpA-like peptidoglycan-associated protein